MAIDKQQLEWVLQQLRELGPVSSRLMFGGAGLYHNELFFGLIAEGRLFLKVDDANREDFVARGAEPFQACPRANARWRGMARSSTRCERPGAMARRTSSSSHSLSSSPWPL